MVTWEYFKKVKRLQVDTWLVNRSIKTYLDLVERLRDLGVVPPREEEVDHLFAVEVTGALTAHVDPESLVVPQPVLPLAHVEDFPLGDVSATEVEDVIEVKHRRPRRSREERNQ